MPVAAEATFDMFFCKGSLCIAAPSPPFFLSEERCAAVHRLVLGQHNVTVFLQVHGFGALSLAGL